MFDLRFSGRIAVGCGQEAERGRALPCAAILQISRQYAFVGIRISVWLNLRQAL